MKRQAVQMAAEHLEQLSGAMRGYLKRDLNEKASAIIREITGGKIYKSSSQMKKLQCIGLCDRTKNWWRLNR